MKRMKTEVLEQLLIGDAIHPNAKYREVFDANGKETDFFIEEKDILYIRGFLKDEFIVELHEDVRNRKEGRDHAYGYFKIRYDMIASKTQEKR